MAPKPKMQVTAPRGEVEAAMAMAMDVENHPKFIPEIYIGKIPPTKKFCRGWNSKRHKYCEQFPGAGTDHNGEGRCKNHGGATPIEHGTYSEIARDTLKHHLTKLVDQEDEDAMNLREELDLMRALVAKRIEEYEDLVDALIEWNALEAMEAAVARRKPKPQPIPRLEELVNLLDKIVNAKDKMHAQQFRDAIPKKDFFRLQDAQADLVAAHVKSLVNVIGEDEVERVIREIKDSWLEIRL